MSALQFVKATRQKVFLKLAITGPSGSGKTYSALRLARGLVGPTGKVAVIDSENGSASLYSDKFDFDVLDITPPFDHDKFVQGINAAVAAGYQAVIIDSASHFWEGILEYKDGLDSHGGNSYTNWKKAGDKFKGILDAVLQSQVHLIACMRSKMDYVQESDANGKKSVKKVGMAPIMRDGVEYEFTTVFDIDLNHKAATSKDRTGLFTDKIFQVTEATGEALEAWRNSAKAPAKVVVPPTTQQPTKSAADILSALLEGKSAEATKYLTSIKWISEGQDWTALTPEQAQKVLANKDRFLANLQPVAAPAPAQ